jgi:hypothetical protein
MPYYISPPPQNFLTRIIASVIAVLTVIGAFMIGMVALLVVAGVGLIAGVAIWLRVIWIKRQLRKSGVNLGANSNTSPAHTSPMTGQVIEAEYTVVSEQEEKNNKTR